MHLKTIIIKRFLSFIEQVKKSTKKIPKQILKLVENDSLSVTGSNLRNIMIFLNKDTIKEISILDVNSIKYSPVSDENKWKISCVKDLIETLQGDMTIDNFSKKEVKEMLDDLCIN